MREGSPRSAPLRGLPAVGSSCPSPELQQNRTETKAQGLQAGKSQQAELLCGQGRGLLEWARHLLGVGTLLIAAPSSAADSGTHHTLACSVGSHAWGSPRWKVLKRRNRS